MKAPIKCVPLISRCLDNLYFSGKHTVTVGETKLISGQVPLMLYNGDVCLYVDGKFSTITLSTHLSVPGTDPKEQLDTFIKLRKFQDAYKLCEQVKDEEFWRKLGEQAIEDLDPAFGIAAHEKR